MNKGVAEFAEIASKQFKNSVAIPSVVRSKVPKLVMITADGEKKDVRTNVGAKADALLVYVRAGARGAMDLGAARRVREGNVASAVRYIKHTHGF